MPSSEIHKIALFYYSLTGNTEYVCRQLAKCLEKKDKTVQLIDLIPALRDGHDDDLVQIMNESDCLGFASLVWAWLPAPPFCAWLTRIPSSALKDKPVFSVFCSGGHPGSSERFTLRSLQLKGAIPVANLDIRAPGNFFLSLPTKPNMSIWGTDDIDQIAPFADRLVTALKASPLPVLDTTLSAISQLHIKAIGFAVPSLDTPSVSMEALIHQVANSKMSTMLPPPSCDKSLCEKCGQCIRDCIAGAITADVEDGFPTFNPERCIRCGRCFNRCPKEAITIGKFSRNRTRYSFNPSRIQKGKSKHVFPNLLGTVWDLNPRIILYPLLFLFLLLVLFLYRHF